MTGTHPIGETAHGLTRLLGAVALMGAVVLGASSCATTDAGLAAKAAGGGTAAESPANTATESSDTADAEEVVPEDAEVVEPDSDGSDGTMAAEVLNHSVPEDVAEQLGWPWDPRSQPVLDMRIDSEVALERHVYSVDKGNLACAYEVDRPAFTIAAGGQTHFCITTPFQSTDKNLSRNARVKATYKIVGDPEKHTVEIFAIAPEYGFNRVDCYIRTADGYVDDRAAYQCKAGFDGEWDSFYPAPHVYVVKRK